MTNEQLTQMAVDANEDMVWKAGEVDVASEPSQE